jgi:hypothetical protein
MWRSVVGKMLVSVDKCLVQMWDDNFTNCCGEHVIERTGIYSNVITMLTNVARYVKKCHQHVNQFSK